MKIVWVALAIGAIVLIAKKSKGGKNSGGSDIGAIEPPAPEGSKINKNQAKKVFLLNIDKFAPILPSLNNESFDPRLWTSFFDSKTETEYNSLVHETNGSVLK